MQSGFQNSRTGGFNQTQGSISGNPASLKGKLMNLEVSFWPSLIDPSIGNDQDNIRRDELSQERSLNSQVREGNSRVRPHHENIGREEIFVKRAYEN